MNGEVLSIVTLHCKVNAKSARSKYDLAATPCSGGVCNTPCKVQGRNDPTLQHHCNIPKLTLVKGLVL